MYRPRSLINAWFSDELEQKKSAWNEYQLYMNTIKDFLPQTTTDFALAEWHYDATNHQCPHDSWVEKLNITEVMQQNDIKKRQINITIMLLGAYHDGHIELDYKNVSEYKLDNTESQQYREYRKYAGHGDWLIDEIYRSDSGKVIHEIIFRWGVEWKIECDEVTFNWKPIKI